jgi:hypothetical protein
LQFRVSLQSTHPFVLLLLAVSGMSLATAVGLAVIYAVGQAAGTNWLTIEAMLPTHGVLNAFGFTLG